MNQSAVGVKVEVAATLLGAQSQFVDRSGQMGNPLFGVAPIAPGDRQWFDIVFPAPPPSWSSYSITVKKAQAVAPGNLVLPVTSLTTTQTGAGLMGDGSYRVTGWAHNCVPAMSAVQAGIIATACRADGKVIGCVEGQVNNLQIAEGQATHYTARFSGRNYADIASMRISAPILAAWTGEGPFNPKFKAGTSDWSSPDTCTELGSAGGSCTYYWTGLGDAQGAWVRVEPRDVGCASATSANVEPGDVASGWRAVNVPAGSLTIRFNSVGGHVVILRVRKDNNDWFWRDEKPMRVQPCDGPPSGPTPIP